MSKEYKVWIEIDSYDLDDSLPMKAGMKTEHEVMLPGIFSDYGDAKYAVDILKAVGDVVAKELTKGDCQDT